VTAVGVGLFFVLVAGVLLVGAIWIGMLIAPRLGRLGDSEEEGTGDDD
jgi:hypothetical protein